MANAVARIRSRRREKTVVATRKPSEQVATIVNATKHLSQQNQDPFSQTYNVVSELSAVEPPYGYGLLRRLVRESSVLPQCIDAMVTNITSFGHRLEYVGPEGEENSAAAINEKSRIEELLKTPNPDYTLTELRSRCRRDLETLGMGYIEASRTPRNDLSMLWHLPASTVRMTRRDTVATMVPVVITRGGRELKVLVPRKFRRFVQVVGSSKTYFKEFGDPRVIDARTGKEDEETPVMHRATEVLAMALYSPGETYGVPRWVSAMPSIMGSREAELTNLDFFTDNAIPAMLITIAGGHLSQSSEERILDALTQHRGRDAVHRAVIIEADPSPAVQNASVEGSSPIPRIEVKTMAHERQTDVLFLDYDRENAKRIRSTFRMHPMFVGLSDDLTHATANASILVTDAQVFGPERAREDDLYHNHLLAVDGVPPVYWRFRTNPPRIVDPENVVAALDTLENLGALTPNIAVGLANELFNLDIAEIEDEWGNYPFTLVTQMASTNATMQVALGTIQAALPDGDADTDEQEPMQKYMNALRGALDVPARVRRRRRMRTGAADVRH